MKMMGQIDALGRQVCPARIAGGTGGAVKAALTIRSAIDGGGEALYPAPMDAHATTRKLGRRPKAAGGEETREAILDAAERLFAARGFNGVTVRQVGEAAGVDAAMAHYYFTSKRGLFDAVFLRRAALLNAERTRRLDALEAGPVADLTVEAVIDAFVDPPLERWAHGGAGWKAYLALVAQVNNTPEWGGETMARYFDPVVVRVIGLMRGLLPGARDEDLYWCYHFLSGALTLTLAETGRIDRLSGGLCASSDYPAVAKRMPAAMAAAFARIAALKP
jgi:AcrR family transcriptional regulator